MASESKSRGGGRPGGRPNLLLLCMDQWDARMGLPEGVTLPALERLESRGVTYDRAYCTVPMCTPSRAAMWTGVHAKDTGLWDNTNFAWIGELSPEIPTVGHMGDGALLCWDGLHSLDVDWALTGALRELTEMGMSGPHGPELGREQALRRAGRKYGAPDFSRRTFFRAVVDGRYKLVRWFSPEAYGNPRTLEELYATGDVALYDLAEDPGELENLGHPRHPRHDPALVERMLGKLHALVRRELGEDRPPFSLDLFGTREVRYRAAENRGRAAA